MSLNVSVAGAEALSQAQRLLAGLDGGLDKALRNAMQRTTVHFRSNISKAIRKTFDISAADLRQDDNVRVRYITGNGVSAEIIISGMKIPLYRYGGTTPKVPTPDKSKRIKYLGGGLQWRTGSPGIAAAAHIYKKSPVTKSSVAVVLGFRSGHKGIFERTGRTTSKGRAELRERMGFSIPDMLGNNDVQEVLEQGSRETFEKRLEHETNRLLNGWGRKL